MARKAAPKPLKNPFKPGDRMPGYVCAKCQTRVPIVDPITDIEDPFRAICPKCGHDAEYHKSQIRRLQAVRTH